MTAAAAARTCAAYVNGVAFTPNAPAISLFLLPLVAGTEALYLPWLLERARPSYERRGSEKRVAGARLPLREQRQGKERKRSLLAIVFYSPFRVVVLCGVWLALRDN
jgi:hypothetical protein